MKLKDLENKIGIMDARYAFYRAGLIQINEIARNKNELIEVLTKAPKDIRKEVYRFCVDNLSSFKGALWLFKHTYLNRWLIDDWLIDDLLIKAGQLANTLDELFQILSKLTNNTQKAGTFFYNNPSLITNNINSLDDCTKIIAYLVDNKPYIGRVATRIGVGDSGWSEGVTYEYEAFGNDFDDILGIVCEKAIDLCRCIESKYKIYKMCQKEYHILQVIENVEHAQLILNMDISEELRCDILNKLPDFLKDSNE